MQFMVHTLGGSVKGAEKREYGFASLDIRDHEGLYKDIDKISQCWMSHGDSIESLPSGFEITASTANTPVASCVNRDKRLYGLQFHPEVHHTPQGKEILNNFLYEICGCEPSWTMTAFAKEAVEKIRENVGDGKVILGLSGGVDSSVTALLVHKAVGANLTWHLRGQRPVAQGRGQEAQDRLKAAPENQHSVRRCRATLPGRSSRA